MMEIKKKKTALLSNVTVDLIAGRLRRKYDFYIPEGFDTWIQDIVDPSSGLYREDPDAAAVLLDGRRRDPGRTGKKRKTGSDPGKWL